LRAIARERLKKVNPSEGRGLSNRLSTGLSESVAVVLSKDRSWIDRNGKIRMRYQIEIS
jgi:hypothetical protein